MHILVFNFHFSTLKADQLSEEDELLRAIALSLGQDGSSGSSSSKTEEQKEKEKEPSASSSKDEEKKKSDEDEDLNPLAKEVLDGFSDALLSGCIELVSRVPECVYRVCDLLAALAKRNGQEWRNRALVTVKDKVCTHMYLSE